jgi:hypothetical protein
MELDKYDVESIIERVNYYYKYPESAFGNTLIYDSVLAAAMIASRLHIAGIYCERVGNVLYFDFYLCKGMETFLLKFFDSECNLLDTLRIRMSSESEARKFADFELVCRQVNSFAPYRSVSVEPIEC